MFPREKQLPKKFGKVKSSFPDRSSAGAQEQQQQPASAETRPQKLDSPIYFGGAGKKNGGKLRPGERRRDKKAASRDSTGLLEFILLTAAAAAAAAASLLLYSRRQSSAAAVALAAASNFACPHQSPISLPSNLAGSVWDKICSCARVVLAVCTDSFSLALSAELLLRLP